MTLIQGLAALAVLAVVAFLVLGPARIWGVFGPADLGPVDFARLERRGSPNDSLACPEGFCGGARADIPSPVFAMDARALAATMERVLEAERGLARVAADAAAGTARYVQRTPLLGFPDTIELRYVDLPGGRSTLAIYSRSKLGHSDLGANRARIARWLQLLAAAAPPAR
jgi:uncharacterized protein (DUF1499 family)